MAAKKKVTRVLRLQVAAGEASPGVVGKDLGPLGINTMEFCRQYNSETQKMRGFVVPAEITVYEDRSFTMIIKTPTTASLLLNVLGIAKGSARQGTGKVGIMSREQLRKVAEIKLPDLNTTDLEKAEKIVAGTARSMGIEVKE
jgi:large subunit ribosomal protein L11